MDKIALIAERRKINNYFVLIDQELGRFGILPTQSYNPIALPVLLPSPSFDLTSTRLQV